MIYLLVQRFYPWLDRHGLGFLRVFKFITFQVAASILLSFLLCLLLGPRVIEWLRKQKIGDNPNFDQEDMNLMMKSKKNTPTMGGLLIIFSIGLTTVLLADLKNFYVEMGLICLIVLGAVGAVDDWLKLTLHRRAAKLATAPPAEEIVVAPSPAAAAIGAAPKPPAVSRQGLTSLEKLMFQIGLGAMLAYWTYHYGHQLPPTHTLYFPFFKNLQFGLNLTTFILMATFIMTGFSNAVNLTDGLDGLASGCMAIVGIAFVVLSLIAGDLGLSTTLFLPYVETSGQMAVIAGAICGATLGFLWFNCNPARVFMGDTGSLALGGLIAYISIIIRQELMLVLIGGIFVAEALSVIIQVSYFKYTRRKFGEGRRIFLMSPLHHHFQKKGWSETQVVVRFWLIGAMLAALALATIKLR
jgi:phospho-N-acetylmuramoyl-pentapeptide-transferase